MFCITSAVSVLGAYKPCPREARRFWLALFCSLLILNMSHVHIAPKCDTALPLVRQQHTRHAWSHWMNGSRHTKNANRQTYAQRFLLLLERRKCSAPLPPKLRIFGVDYTEASKLKNGIQTSPKLNTLSLKRSWTWTYLVVNETKTSKPAIKTWGFIMNNNCTVGKMAVADIHYFFTMKIITIITGWNSMSLY